MTELLEHPYVFYVTAPGKRPPFALMQNFVWSGEHVGDTDTDGNSFPPDSTTWTELTVITRDEREERFDVDPFQEEPLILIVRSEIESLAARAAYALAVYTGGCVSGVADGPFADPEILIPQMGAAFDLESALRSNLWLKKPK